MAQLYVCRPATHCRAVARSFLVDVDVDEDWQLLRRLLHSDDLEVLTLRPAGPDRPRVVAVLTADSRHTRSRNNATAAALINRHLESLGRPCRLVRDTRGTVVFGAQDEAGAWCDLPTCFLNDHVPDSERK